MANKTLSARIQNRVDTADNWSTNNPVLLRGEIGVELDTTNNTALIKIGDGVSHWNSLNYINNLGTINNSSAVSSPEDINTLKEQGASMIIDVG